MCLLFSVIDVSLCYCCSWMCVLLIVTLAPVWVDFASMVQWIFGSMTEIISIWWMYGSDGCDDGK